ncbi:hypothetical protein BU16DRAFT_284465 [Lophium mytilinum]|uniref:Uncharacterized protein n=1 Tax=Lophium mytilinum TaxID=390894 RepID=A0A6A6R8R3_9PEZI|nr:hypothetical protein BU16DRAFT_284465 [Lophium mytilinum]
MTAHLGLCIIRPHICVSFRFFTFQSRRFSLFFSFDIYVMLWAGPVPVLEFHLYIFILSDFSMNLSGP